MSWTDIFPVLSEQMMQEYREGVSPEESVRFEEWLGVERLPIYRSQRANG